MRTFKESELIINQDGSIYHLKLRPEHIADTLLIVGDQGRVPMISKYFDSVEHKIQNREFLTHTGYLGKKRLTVLSTGIGTDNIDIVLNEIDAAVNIDLEQRVVKERHTTLDIIRLGTTGALQADIPVDSMVASAFGLGFDGLMHFYSYDTSLEEQEMADAFVRHVNWNEKLPYPYIFSASPQLLQKVAGTLTQGITGTANGFYGPQGRELRIPTAYPELNRLIESFEYQGHRVTNFEMETSALFALGKVLKHNTLTVCNVIANRARKEYSKDAKKSIDQMIRYVLEKISA
ncbi:MAG: nucleoside phosphorylase [Bacteroidales bacterium]|nr:nucleoside phosphorylase [Bacteroidales bacterium]